MNAELENAINQVYQKVGRNVVFFHKLEVMLKRITATSQISGYVSEVEQKAQKQIESINKQTLGQVAGLFIENNASGDDIDLGPDNPKEPWINIGHKYSGERAEEDARVTMALVEERNKLIHQFDQICDLTTLARCEQAGKFLDHQYDRINKELRHLDSYMQAAQVGARLCLTLMASDAFRQRDQICDLQKRPSLMLLGKLSIELKREDGWAVVQKAASHLEQEASAEIQELKKKYHCKSLKELMLTAHVFDFLEETTKKGGIRLLYRVKPEYNEWVTEGKSFIYIT